MIRVKSGFENLFCQLGLGKLGGDDRLINEKNGGKLRLQLRIEIGTWKEIPWYCCNLKKSKTLVVISLKKL